MASVTVNAAYASAYRAWVRALGEYQTAPRGTPHSAAARDRMNDTKVALDYLDAVLDEVETRASLRRALQEGRIR